MNQEEEYAESFTEGREISNDDKRWDDLTERMTFEVRTHCGGETRRYAQCVRNVLRKQVGCAKLPSASVMLHSQCELNLSLPGPISMRMSVMTLKYW